MEPGGRRKTRLSVHFNLAATGALVGTADAHRIAGSTRVESLHIWPPGEKAMIQIGRFGIPYKLGGRSPARPEGSVYHHFGGEARLTPAFRAKPSLSTFRLILPSISAPYTCCHV